MNGEYVRIKGDAIEVLCMTNSQICELIAECDRETRKRFNRGAAIDLSDGRNVKLV